MNNSEKTANDVRDAFNTDVIRGDNRHTGRLWSSDNFTVWYGIAYILSHFANSYLFYLLISLGISSYALAIGPLAIVSYTLYTFTVYAACRFLFYNMTGAHSDIILSLIGTMGVTFGVRDAESDNGGKIGDGAGEWFKFFLSLVGIIPGAFAGIYSTGFFVPDMGTLTYSFNFGAPKLGILYYLNVVPFSSTPVASNGVAFLFEMLAATVLYFGYYWANGHRSIARSRVFSSVAIGAAGAFGALIAGPYTSAPMSLLIWIVHAIRTGSVAGGVIYALSVAVAFLIPTAVVFGMWMVNNMANGMPAYGSIGSHLTNYAGSKNV